MTPVDIGDTQGTLQAKKSLKHSINAQRHLYESTHNVLIVRTWILILEKLLTLGQSANKAAHSGFETQRRRHKTGVSVNPQKELKKEQKLRMKP